MQFGIGFAPYDRWENLAQIGDVARAADDLGFDYVTLSDHIVVPMDGEEPRSGVVFPDVFVMAAHLAAITRRVRIVFHALVIPIRDPLQTAKALATLDQVSGGRIVVVAGAGWLRSEFDALGVPFHDRGPRTDEYLRAMKALWTEREPSFSGTYVSFPRVHFEPRCVQRPHVPIWVAGTGAAPFRRVVELGDGWAPMTGTFDERARDIARLRARAEAAGRDPSGLAFVGALRVGDLDAETARLARGHHATARDRRDERRRAAATYDEARAEVERHRQAGFTHLGVSMGWETPEELTAKLAEFAHAVIDPLRSA